MEPALIIAISILVSIAFLFIMFYLIRRRFERRFSLAATGEGNTGA